MTPEELKLQLLREADTFRREEERIMNDTYPGGYEWLHAELQSMRAHMHVIHNIAIENRVEFERYKQDLNQCSIDKDNNIEMLKDAFPAKDIHGHRTFHERLIQKASEEAEVIKEAKKKVVSGVSWFGLTVIAVALWEFAKRQMHL